MSAVWMFGGSDPRHESAVHAILRERQRQDELKAAGRFKFTCADNGLGNMERLACVVEEVGEVAAEELTLRRLTGDRDGGRKSFDDTTALREEVTQVAALCLAWLESDCNSLPRMGA